MKLYLVEAHLEDEGHYLREWVTSQGDAASKRAALMKTYGLPRKDIRTTAVEVDTRKEGLLLLLNSMAGVREGYLGRSSMVKQPIFAQYLDHMGSDLSVVNAARASFGKESDWADAEKRTLKADDARLIRYLATGYRTSEWLEFLDEIRDAAINGSLGDLTGLLHAYKRRAQHFAPFAHPQVQLRIQIPIFLARQFVKHQVGGVWSEESRRYISDEPGVWFPAEWHSRPEDVKQGSGGLVEAQGMCSELAEAATERALASYVALLGRGAAPEEARIVLPLNMMTTVVWTGSLLFWSRVCNQRVDSHAQLAAQELGRLISGIVGPLFPVSWDALTGLEVVSER